MTSGLSGHLLTNRSGGEAPRHARARSLGRLARGAVFVATCAALALACYNAGDGTAPPPQQIYFPVGLVVSSGGSVLYVANSDFDLQWNGGTVQSYDLSQVRADAAIAIKDPSLLAKPFAGHPNGKLTRPTPPPGSCPSNPPVTVTNGDPSRQPLGESCSPPVDSTLYVKDSVVIGAFATDMELSCSIARRNPGRWRSDPNDANSAVNFPCAPTRLYVPVRGDASLTWADVAADDTTTRPAADATPASYPPFALDCGTRVNGRCDAAHHAGNNATEPGNTRHVTMPGEPFGMAESEDGSSIVVTHQTDTKVSLLATGFGKNAQLPTPSLQFVLDGLPSGGNGIAAVPHDPQAFTSGVAMPSNAFLLTTRAAAEIDLLRYYADQGLSAVSPDPNDPASQSELRRPFITKEAVFPLTANAGGTDSRGIVVDPTPRIRCKLAVLNSATPLSKEEKAAKLEACARRPARVFIANRTPATLLVGEIGEPAVDAAGGYDADRLVIYQNIPLTFGPSRIYLAPIVDASGALSLRVFIVCFDSAAIFVFDPEAGVVENIIRVGQGPYAMAFDPFDLESVARGDKPQDDPRIQGPARPGDPSYDPDLDVKRYRFAYVASFTKSYIQVIDLDNSRTSKETFERVVFTLGQPTSPKGH